MMTVQPSSTISFDTPLPLQPLIFPIATMRLKWASSDYINTDYVCFLLIIAHNALLFLAFSSQLFFLTVAIQGFPTLVSSSFKLLLVCTSTLQAFNAIQQMSTYNNWLHTTTGYIHQLATYKISALSDIQ